MDNPLSDLLLIRLCIDAEQNTGPGWAWMSGCSGLVEIYPMEIIDWLYGRLAKTERRSIGAICHGIVNVSQVHLASVKQGPGINGRCRLTCYQVLQFTDTPPDYQDLLPTNGGVHHA